ncbi:MAG: flavin reductase family protein [Bryobacteraceae bacterium]
MQLTIVDESVFRRACAKFATGITIATVQSPDGRPYGMTANSFTSVSCCPPLILICVDYRCSILSHFRSSPYLGINILSDTQRDLSVRFSQRQLDRFDGLQWRPGATGVPILSGVLAALECCVTQTVEAGDHAIFIAEVVKAQCAEGKPLLYFGSRYQEVSD